MRGRVSTLFYILARECGGKEARREYNVFNELDARDVLGETLGEVGEDCDVQQIEEELEAACHINQYASVTSNRGKSTSLSLLLASFDELPVVEPLERQWLTDEVARLRLGFGFFFFGHVVYIMYLIGYRYVERTKCRKRQKNWWSS